MTDEERAIWERRRQRALRWAATDLCASPALATEQETEETLAADPVPASEKKGRDAAEQP